MGVELPLCLRKKKAKRCREVMSKLVILYDMDAELPDPSETNNPGIDGLFAGVQNYSEK